MEVWSVESARATVSDVGFVEPPNRIELQSQRVADLLFTMLPAAKKVVPEFSRSMHAEQSALTDAARRGVSTQDKQLTVTTFPCHECTPMIVGAGIKRVVYMQPFPKSLADQLFDDSVSIENEESNKVTFTPFVGISPRLYNRLFEYQEDLVPRKKRVSTTNQTLLPSMRTYHASKASFKKKKSTPRS